MGSACDYLQPKNHPNTKKTTGEKGETDVGISFNWKGKRKRPFRCSSKGLQKETLRAGVMNGEREGPGWRQTCPKVLNSKKSEKRIGQGK